MFKHLTTIFTILALVTGCAAAPKNVVLNQHSSTAKSNVKVEKVLLIYDVSLKKAHMKRALLYTVDELIENQYGPVAKIMIDKISAQGIQSDYEIYSSPSPIVLPESGYSHILLEKLVSTKKTTRRSTYSESDTFSSNTWEATLYEVNKGSNIAIYSQSYISDSIRCFNNLAIAADKETCRNDYIKLVLNHLSPIAK